MRLFLVPISTRRALIYCQRSNKQTKELGYVDRIQKYATEKWAQWEAAEKGWQKTLAQYGNRALQRIPYEEWGLKSIPPLSARRKQEKLANKEKAQVQAYYPGNVVNKENVSEILRTLATERQKLHERKMWWSLIGIPFTIPFALVPIIPNIPFFYIGFRAWSHWRALNGSRHLEFLLDNKLITPTVSPDLAKVYSASSRPPAKFAALAPTPPSADPSKSPSSEEIDIDERLLLDQSSSKTLARSVMVPELAAEVDRALRQVEKTLSVKRELAEEKRKIDDAHKTKK